MNNVVVYASDTNYVPHLAASILSVIENSGDIGIKFVVLDNDIEENEKDKLLKLCEDNNCELYFINVQKCIDNMKLNTFFNKTAYARLYIADVVNEDKALYLDCDTIVTSSLKELFDLNMDNYLVAAVQDTVSLKLRKVVGLSEEEAYVNTGVLLLNLRLWREINIKEKFFKCIDSFNGDVPHNDQGIINAVCHKKILILNAKYNIHDTMLFYNIDQLKELFEMSRYYEREQFNEAKKSPVIIHYTEAHYGRPWYSDSNHPYKNIYLEYRKKISEFWNIKNEHTNIKKRIRRTIKQILYSIFPFCIYKKILFYERRKMEDRK